MKLLVTGGAGFIGANFIHYWVKHHPDDQIVNLDALTYAGNLENLISLQDNPNYTFIKGDICDKVLVTEALQGVDLIVHFAAETHVDRSILGPEAFVRTNVLGTYTLLQAARELGIKHFHHISTDEVFGSLELGADTKFSESTKYDPHSPYSASKAGSDHLVRAYGDTYGLTYTITNCTNNYGPFHFPEKFIPLAITNLMEGKPVPVYGDGMQIRDWLFVEDHCRAIEHVVTSGKKQETFCVGGMSQDVPNIEVLKMIIRLMGKDEATSIQFVKDRPGHDVRYAVDWSKMETTFGWKPSVTLEEGLQRTIAWYQENQSWWQRIKSGEYQSYYQTQYGK